MNLPVRRARTVLLTDEYGQEHRGTPLELHQIGTDVLLKTFYYEVGVRY